MDADIFEHAPVPKAYFSMAIPVVLSMLVTLVYNTVDTFFVSRTGDPELVAGVSLAAPVFTMMIALGDVFGLGGSSVISRLFGAHDYLRASKASVLCFYGSMAIGAVVLVGGLALESPILGLLGANGASRSYAAEYYEWIVLGSPFIIFSIVPSNLLRAEGFVLPSMIGQLAGTGINIILNPILISVLGWGAAGSAIATVLSNIIASVYYAWFIITRSGHLSLDPRIVAHPRTRATTTASQGDGAIPAPCPRQASDLAEIVRIGIPSSITNVMQSVGIIVVNHYLVPFGDNTVAAMGIALKLTMIATLILVGFSFGAQPLIGYAYGSGNIARLRSVLRFALTFEVGLSIVMSLALAIRARSLMALFIDDAEIIEKGSTMLAVQMTSTALVAVIMLATVTFQSAGKALGAFLLSAARQGVFLCLALAVLSPTIGYQGIIAGQPVSDVLTATLSIVLVRLLLPELADVMRRR